MILKKLKVSGFKTFADTTEIEFAKGATALVGPNGCGKSNIVDAVRWVLGESSASSMRSEKMDDVIFAGSTSRKPISAAEVSLTFSAEGKVPGMADEADITVKRLIYRDGQNQYYLNDQKVTKSEVQRLFLDTGIGKSSYSIMEQGKVDMILSSSPEERRYVFEEAAGISLYKHQLKKTGRKLEATENNLLRVNDILSELEREYKQKQKQAEKTRRYFDLENELKTHGLKIHYARLTKIEKEKNEIESKLGDLWKKRDKLHNRIEDMEKQRQSDGQLREDTISAIHNLDKEIELKKAQADAVANQLDKAAVDIQDAKTKRTDLEHQLKKTQDSIKQVQGNIQKFKQLELDLTTNLDTARAKIETEEKRQAEASARIDAIRTKIAANENSIEELKRQSAGVRGEIDVAVRELITEIEKIKRKMRSDGDKRETLAGSLGDELKTLTENYQELVQIADTVPSKRTKAQSDRLKSLSQQSQRVPSILKKFSEYRQTEDGFRKLLFDKKGIHARKEELDAKQASILDTIDNLEKENKELGRALESEQKEIQKAIQTISRLEADIREISTRQETASTNQKTTIVQLSNIEEQEKFFQSNLTNSNQQIADLNQRIQELKRKKQTLAKEVEKAQGKLDKLRIKEEGLNQKLSGGGERLIKDKDELEAIFPRISAMEAKAGEVGVNFENLVQEIYNNYHMTLDETKSKFKDAKIQLDKENREYSRLQSELRAMGQINPLALEEYERIREMYEHNLRQKKDIEDARGNLQTLIREVEEKASEQFLVTFNKISKIFQDIFAQLFVGGTGEIFLSDPTRPLETGIEVAVQPPGKKPKTLKMLSGGERAMTAVAILFATFKVKSAPFCFLDEIDAPWDESNIGRFLNMLSEFMNRSQFVIVTHAKKTMAVADQIIGVTMEEPGVSKLVAIELEREEKREVSQPAGASSS